MATQHRQQLIRTTKRYGVDHQTHRHHNLSLPVPITKALQITTRAPTHNVDDGGEVKEEGEDLAVAAVETTVSSHRIKEIRGEMVTATIAATTAIGRRNVVSRNKTKPRRRTLRPTPPYMRNRIRPPHSFN